MAHLGIFKAATVALSLAFGAVNAGEVPQKPSREILQPVHEYFHLKETLRIDEKGALVLNGFLNYTHLGTDFGFLGPHPLQISSTPGGLRADFSDNPAGWGGVWHSLNGLARQNVPMDLKAP